LLQLYGEKLFSLLVLVVVVVVVTYGSSVQSVSEQVSDIHDRLCRMAAWQPGLLLLLDDDLDELVPLLLRRPPCTISSSGEAITMPSVLFRRLINNCFNRQRT
jgi:hypothetical protein